MYKLKNWMSSNISGNVDKEADQLLIQKRFLHSLCILEWLRFCTSKFDLKTIFLHVKENLKFIIGISQKILRIKFALSY